MSGSIFPALQIHGPDILGGLQQAAQTGLINEQSRAAEIANQGADLNLQLRKMFLEPFLRPQQAPQGGAAPGGGGGGGGNVLAAIAPGGGGGPAASGGQGSASAPGAAASGAPVSPFGAVSTPFGVPMPAGVLMGVLQSQNPDQAVKQALDMRRQRLYERAAQATDVKSWNTALEQSYREGWVDTPTYNQLWNRFDLAPKVVQSLASPEAYLGYLGSAARMGMEPDATGRLGTSPQIVAGQAALKGATTGAEQAALNSPSAIAGRAMSAGAVAGAEESVKSQYGEPVKIKVATYGPDGNPDGNYVEQTIPRAMVPELSRLGIKIPGLDAGAAPAGDGRTGIPTPKLDTVQSGSGASFRVAEDQAWRFRGLVNDLEAAGYKVSSGGGYNDRNIAGTRTPSQHASGYAIDVNPEANGQGTAGNIPADVARQVAQKWGLTWGGDWSGKTRDPMHFEYKPQVARADTGAATSGAPAAPTPLAPPPPVAPSPAARAGIQAPTAAPIIPGAIMGPSALGPVGEAQLAVAKKGVDAGIGVTEAAIKADQAAVEKSLDSAYHAQAAQTQLLNIRKLVPQINAGTYGEARQAIQNYFATFSPEWGQKFVSALTAGKIDPTKAGATQEFVKLTLQQAGTAERDTLGSHGGLGAIQLYQKAFPNVEMQPDAIKDMTNLLLVAHQRDIDYGMGANQHFQTQRDAFTNGTGPYASVEKYDPVFLKQNPPQVYASAAAAMNGKPYAEWAKDLGGDAEKIAAAVNIIRRVDPTASIMWADGKRHTFAPVPAAGTP